MSNNDEWMFERIRSYNLSPDDVDLRDLEAGEGETVDTAELPTETIEPESFSEIYEMVGVSGEDTLSLREEDIPSSTPSYEELASALQEETTEEGSIDEAVADAIEAILNSGLPDPRLKHWRDLLDEAIREGFLDPTLGVFTGRDITIRDGGRFHVDRSTDVLCADEIEIHGSGALTYDGRTKIDCRLTTGRP